MKRAIVATAGHVDHGKTALLKGLTGVDCDRWKEEKERGITIDLGFTHLRFGELQVGFVDVPGHERFVKNMLAGSGSVDAFLLVISAEEGVKPQTVEHAAILNHLKIERGICALTKIDLADDDLLDLAEEEAREFLTNSFKREVQIIRTSATNGTGLKELKTSLEKLILDLPENPDIERPARLPIDRAFHLKGIGTVVTGSLVWGSISRGDHVFLLPEGKEVRVRTLQVHDEEREKATAKERTSLNISGAELLDLSRGQIISSIHYPAARIILVEGDLDRNVKNNQRVRLHCYSKEEFGRIHFLPTRERFQIILESPLSIVRGDRIVIRRYSPQDLLGGGLILDTFLPRLKKSRHPIQEILACSFEDSAGWENIWLKTAGRNGIHSERWPSISGFPPSSVKKGTIPEFGTLIGQTSYHPEVLKELLKELTATVKEIHANNPLSEGIPSAELKSRLDLQNDLLLTHLAHEAGLRLEQGKIFPGEGSFRSSEGDQTMKTLLDILREKNSFVEMTDVAPILKLEEKQLRSLLTLAVKDGEIVRLSEGIYLHRDVADSMIETIYNQGWKEFSVADAKDLFSTSRKFAIPFLEYLDGARVTVRRGNQRVLLPKKK